LGPAAVAVHVRSAMLQHGNWGVCSCPSLNEHDSHEATPSQDALAFASGLLARGLSWDGGMVQQRITEPDTRSGRTERLLYTVFGLNLASDFGFASRLLPASGVPDVVFACVPVAPPGLARENPTPIYVSPYRTARGESTFFLYRLDTCNLLRFTEVADFYVGAQRITCHLLDQAHDYLVEIRLLGSVLSFWLEQQGIPALHASAVVIEGHAVVFLSLRGNGKSTIAAALMQDGYPLLADDILPVEEREGTFVGRPGYPQMRLWPDEARHFLGQHRELERVHPAYSKRRVPVGADGFGSFCQSSQPLGCLYVLERRESPNGQPEIEIAPISPRDAVIELTRYSFSARTVEAVGLQPHRLKLFAEMAERVPVRRIVYPSGFQHLSRTRDAILEDL